MKPIRKYICLVDNYRRPSRQRNTCGRYVVCAKTKQKAKEYLQRAIGFGSVQVYYEIDENNTRITFSDNDTGLTSRVWDYAKIPLIDGYVTMDNFCYPYSRLHHATDHHNTYRYEPELETESQQRKYLRRKMRNH